jgi:hypothetical protein
MPEACVFAGGRPPWGWAREAPMTPAATGTATSATTTNAVPGRRGTAPAYEASSSAASAATLRAISSRTARTSPRGRPAGSSSSQST